MSILDDKDASAAILAELRELDAGPDTPETWKRKCDLLRAMADLVRARHEVRS